jgi:xanthine/CO dehydrogenase XdhC/CoxF family maturation factor
MSLILRKLTELEESGTPAALVTDVGGKTPQEVAISVAAELLGVHHGRVATPAR